MNRVAQTVHESPSILVHRRNVQFSVHLQFMNVHEQVLKDFHEQIVPSVHERSCYERVQFAVHSRFMNVHELNGECW